MANLMLSDDTQETQTSTKLAKSSRKKSGTITSAIPNEIFLAIERVDSKISAGFTAKLLDMLVLHADELEGITKESMQMEYILKLSVEKAEQAGREKGRQKAENEIKHARIEAIRKEAEIFMSRFDAYFGSLLKLGMSFDAASNAVKTAAQQHYVSLDVTQNGSSYEYEWDFALES